MNKIKLDKGITLISLIITIVVVTILSAVAISVISDTGIIQRSKSAQKEYEIAQEKEKIALAANEAYLAGLGIITEEELEIALDSNLGVGEYSIDSSNSEYFLVTITDTGREYKVYKNGEVDDPTSGSGTMPEAGAGSDPVKVMEKATLGIKAEKNSTIDGKIYSSENPIIPAGFTAINTETSNWDAASGPEVDNGLVIRDESGNEFVWVPVADNISTTQYISGTNYREPVVITGVASSETVDSASGIKYDAVLENLQRAGCTQDLNNDGTVNAYDFKIQLTNEYKLMAESVNKYDGFYVGRFETSKNGVNPQSRRSTYASGSGEEIITANNSSRENDWYGLYALNRKYSTSSVQGSMMCGIQYDKMMIWMGDAANTTIMEYNKEKTCGTAENDFIKNVYDLYGNSREWILEAHNTYSRVFRGGCYLGSRNPNSKGANEPTMTSGFKENGSRLALYVK